MNIKNIFHNFFTSSCHKNKLMNKGKTLFKAFIISFLIFINTFENSYAAPEFGVGRLRECYADGSIEGLDFNPTDAGKDVNFVLSNPVCATVIISVYAAVKVGIAAMNHICGTGSAVPRVKPSPFLDARDIAKASYKAASGNVPCIKAVGVATAAFSTAIAELGIIYEIAKDVYDNSYICGSTWTGPNIDSFDMTNSVYKKTVEDHVEAIVNDNSGAIDKEAALSLNLDYEHSSEADRKYREWYYGGVEVKDDPDQGKTCHDPTLPGNPVQRYYLKGLAAGNYNCKKYMVIDGQNDPLTNAPFTEARLQAMNDAYNCCINRASEYICIRYKPVGADTRKKFCKANSRCTIYGITFQTNFIDNDRFICAESYSLCPYNFSLGGGTEECDYFRDGIWDGDRWDMITNADINPPPGSANRCAVASEIRKPDCTFNKKAGKCRNYCQFMQHCTQTSGAIFGYRSGLSSPYFSSACRDFQGDSQNKTSYGSGFILASQKHFSAPIAQCVKETLVNVFYNQAGHSKCLTYGEFPSADGSCPSGQYAGEGSFVHKKGNKVKEKSFFTTIQESMQGFVKMALTLSIVIYGMNILLFQAKINDKKDVMVYLLKIGLVLYFATGTAWQSTFFDGVYGSSAEFARMVFKIEVSNSENKRDGCQFGEITTPDGVTTSTGRSYPPGKKYLAIFDTLDCKIMRYLGFGPEDSAANIASLIFAGFLTGAIGIYFALSVMIFGILMIAATIRALHIFLTSAIAIVLFVFVSPLVLPAALFKRTKGIFDQWLTNLISFVLQPMILFAYIAIFIIVLDRTLIGSATFAGAGPQKAISCQVVCEKLDGTVEEYDPEAEPSCEAQHGIKVNPLDDSFACIMKVDDFGKFPGLELIGISIPILDNLFKENAKERILTVLKSALVMYLLYKFMDEIPGIIASLIGGTQLPGGGPDAANMMKKFVGFARGVQERATRAAGKLGKKGAGKARKGVEAIRGGASSGKSVSDTEARSGSDSTGSSSGSSTSGSSQGSDTSGGGGGSDSTGK